MARETPRTEFGRKLRRHLNEQNVSVRELSRRMQPGDPEGVRRSIARWLSPGESAVNPSPASRKAVAQALGLPEDVFGDEGDGLDDEDLVAPLSRAIHEIVERQVARLLAKEQA